jgi:hypothetical protein
MSVHYLIDPFTTNGDVIDVVTAPENGQTEATGATIIRIPDGVPIRDNPTNRTELIAEKYDAMLASYPGFENILADPCLDTLTFDVANSLRAQFSDGWVNHSAQPFISPLGSSGFITSVTSLLPNPAPEQAILVWEEYSFVDSDDIDGRFRRTYQEEEGIFTVETSFDGGANTQSVSNGGVINIPPAEQGTDFQIVFLNVYNSPPTKVYLGSWALIY